MNMRPVQFVVENQLVFSTLNKNNDLIVSVRAANDGADLEFDQVVTTLSKVWNEEIPVELHINIRFVDILGDLIDVAVSDEGISAEDRPLLESLRDHCQAFINRIDEVTQERS